jgi:hypothetical protein
LAEKRAAAKRPNLAQMKSKHTQLALQMVSRLRSPRETVYSGSANNLALK